MYPRRGATLIEGIETLQAFGTARECLVLRFADADLTLRVPSEQAAAVGLRQIITPDELEDVLDVLRRREVRVPANWSRRFKNHTAMLRSGDVYQLAGAGAEPQPAPLRQSAVGGRATDAPDGATEPDLRTVPRARRGP